MDDIEIQNQEYLNSLRVNITDLNKRFDFYNFSFKKHKF